MRRTMAFSLALALLASLGSAATVAAASPTYRTSGTATCDAKHSSTFTVILLSGRPGIKGSTEVGRLGAFCDALAATPPYTISFWTDTAKPASWAVITWSGVAGTCADGPRSYRLPTPVVQNATCAAFPDYRVSVQIAQSARV